MNSFSIADNVWLVGIPIFAVTGLWLAFDRWSEKGLLDQVRFRSRKASTSGTPPPSISPERKSSTGPTAPSSYAQTLPPQRREALTNLKHNAISSNAVDEKEIAENLLPMTTNYRTCTDQRYTPTGFSVREVEALGPFPDYAELSGFSLPQSYPEFNIDKALPRPYRPFRWAYHQTMCMFPQLK